MKLLLDTHTLLWFVLDDPQLSRTAQVQIEDPSNEVYVSPVSCWEIAIKMSVGKYTLTVPHATFFETVLVSTGCTVVPIEPRHTAGLVGMPFHHKDPFDRLLVATAIADGLTLVSADAIIDAYPVARAW